jgi:hypothetical protein
MRSGSSNAKTELQDVRREVEAMYSYRNSVGRNSFTRAEASRYAELLDREAALLHADAA